MAKEVELLDFWPSRYGMRVRVALAEKGVDYDYIDEDLKNKSERLLEMNPVHKKIPVLIHNNRPVCESSIIVQYIDEVWSNNNPLLPSDPYLRAQARFWTDFINNKIYDCPRRFWLPKTDEDEEEAKKEFIEGMKVLEQELGDKTYFGGDTINIVDVALIAFYPWFYTYETFGSFKIQDHCPKVFEWVKRCMQRESIAKSLVDDKKVYEFALQLRKKQGIE